MNSDCRIDPVGAGFVASMAHPGGNMTGFANFEEAMGGKWLELLMEVAPHLTRVAVLIAGHALWKNAQAAAASIRVRLIAVEVNDSSGVEAGDRGFFRRWKGRADRPAGSHLQHASGLDRGVGREAPASSNLPILILCAGGGLVSYGIDQIAQFRGAAQYVDRILRGEKPSDLPVQAPTKFELAINLKTAKALGIDIPTTLLAHADEVIE